MEVDLFDHIVINGGKFTVLELVEKYVSWKIGVRYNTVTVYKTVINILKKGRLAGSASTKCACRMPKMNCCVWRTLKIARW